MGCQLCQQRCKQLLLDEQWYGQRTWDVPPHPASPPRLQPPLPPTHPTPNPTPPLVPPPPNLSFMPLALKAKPGAVTLDVLLAMMRSTVDRRSATEASPRSFCRRSPSHRFRNSYTGNWTATWVSPMADAPMPLQCKFEASSNERCLNAGAGVE